MIRWELAYPMIAVSAPWPRIVANDVIKRDEDFIRGVYTDRVLTRPCPRINSDGPTTLNIVETYLASLA